MEETANDARPALTKLRWALALNGLLSLALGVLIIVWPGISLYSLVIVFGAYAFARGILGLAAAISDSEMDGRGWLVVSSIASIAVGVIVALETHMSALALLYVIGAYALVLGVVSVAGAFWLPLTGVDTALLALTGVLSILFGIVMFAKPGDGALVLLALIAAYALVIGLAELTVAIGGRRLLASAGQVSATATPQASR
jgi:uncharacterized membrane protein HdeD (DUF308 family)